jgi:hypothetical protein
MCGKPLWGLAGLASCSYFAYLSYSHVRHAEFDWQHDWGSILAYAVWVLLMAALASEASCWLERLFFVLVLSNFALGFVIAVWANAPYQRVRDLRVISIWTWALAALVSAVIIFTGGEPKHA